jgi:hypothetical protein
VRCSVAESELIMATRDEDFRAWALTPAGGKFFDEWQAERKAAGFVAASASRPVYAAAPLASSNPLAAQTLANAPDAYASAARVAPVPELFHSGARPTFTASGVDPAVLDGIAWPARHPAARAESAAVAYQLLQDYPVTDPHAVSYALAEFQDDPGNIDYQHRMQTWIVGGSSPHQIYASLFAPDPRDLEPPDTSPPTFKPTA